jgi:hypothetical protein
VGKLGIKANSAQLSLELGLKIDQKKFSEFFAPLPKKK